MKVHLPCIAIPLRQFLYQQRRLYAGLLLAACVAIAGCAGHRRELPAPSPTSLLIPDASIQANANPWNITTEDIAAPSHPYLGNGYVGFQTGPLGGAGTGPLLCLMAGNYHGDSLQNVPYPANYELSLKGPVLAVGMVTGYRQSLQMRDGILTTSFNWNANGKQIPIVVTTFASRANPHVVVVHVSAPATTGLAAEHNLQSFPPSGAGRPMRCSIPASAGGPEVEMAAKSVVSPGKNFEWTGYTAIATSDDGPRPTRIVNGIVQSLGPSSYASILAAHEAAWHALWQSDITIDGDPASQQIVHAALFYLLESARAGSRWSIPPMGLSNNAWSGHIFWDAPMWMFPALALLHPDEARPMVDYEVRMLPQARDLAAKEGKPGASFPWESARSGKEAAAPPYNQERHVTADVANMIWRYYLITGDKGWLRQYGYPVLEATADYWAARMQPAGGSMHIRQVVGPDETAGIVDDDAYTNGVVRVNLQDAASAAHELGLKPPDAWAQDAAKLVIPKDPASGEPLVYDGYKGQQMKQADPELLIYPLGLITQSGLIRKMLATYPPRISPGGPAMTDSIYTTIAARQGMTDDAMRFFRHSYEPFLVAPFDQISEKHSHVRQYCFLTGFGGLLQSVEYGMGGITIADGQITASAHLPAAWKKLAISGIHFRGQTYDLQAASGQTALIRRKSLSPGKLSDLHS